MRPWLSYALIGPIRRLAVARPGLPGFSSPTPARHWVAQLVSASNQVRRHGAAYVRVWPPSIFSRFHNFCYSTSSWTCPTWRQRQIQVAMATATNAGFRPPLTGNNGSAVSNDRFDMGDSEFSDG